MPLFTTAVRVDMIFTFEPPASGRDRLGQPHTQKPDKDNLEKLVLDALVKARVLADDSLAAAGEPLKLWGERAGVAVVVTELATRPAQAPTGAAGGDAPDWLTGS
jgi:Holliday junction resolvase RusA-like endonuclease